MKKNSSRLLLAITVLALLFTLAVSTANAGSMGNGAVQRQKLVVDSIDATAGTIVLKSMVDNSMHTYKIDASTRFSVGNMKGTIDQIEVGQKVANLRAKEGQPPQTLDFLAVNKAVPPPAPPANP